MTQTNFQPLRINWAVKQTWTSPSFLGPALRGMLGRNLRQLVCVQTAETACNSCPQQASCAYGSFFEGPTLGSFSYPPQFVLQPPEPSARTYDKGETFSCMQLIFGSSFQFLREIFLAWQQSTLESAPHAIQLSSIDLCDYQGHSLHRWQPNQDIPTPLLQSIPETSAVPKSILLNLHTPLYMRERGMDIRPQNLRPEHLVTGAFRRSKLLVPQWHEHAHTQTFPSQLLQAWARSLKLEHELEWYQQKRWSHRQQKEIPVKGLLGSLTLSGNLEPFWPALAITPLVGLGKFCNFGLGHVTFKPTY